MPGRKGDTEKEGSKRPQRSAAPSAGCGIVVELAVLKFTRVGRNEIENTEFQEISGECEGIPKMKDTRAAALEARCGNWWTAAGGRKKLIGKAAASVPDG